MFKLKNQYVLKKKSKESSKIELKKLKYQTLKLYAKIDSLVE